MMYSFMALQVKIITVRFHMGHSGQHMQKLAPGHHLTWRKTRAVQQIKPSLSIEH